MKTFLILFKDKQPVLFTSQLLENHVIFLQKLHDDKALIICGPFVDNTGAVLIIKSESRQDAEKLISQDPFIQSHYYKNYSIQEFHEANEKNAWLKK